MEVGADTVVTISCEGCYNGRVNHITRGTICASILTAILQAWCALGVADEYDDFIQSNANAFKPVPFTLQGTAADAQVAKDANLLTNYDNGPISVLSPATQANCDPTSNPFDDGLGHGTNTTRQPGGSRSGSGGGGSGGDWLSCNAVPQNVKDFFKSEFDKKLFSNPPSDPGKFDRYLVMAGKESGGNTSDVTDMSSNETQVKPIKSAVPGELIDMKGYENMISSLRGGAQGLSIKAYNIKIDKQTNFGILQMSADQLDNVKNAGILNSYQSKIRNVTNVNDPAVDGLIKSCGTGSFVNLQNPSELLTLKHRFVDIMASCPAGSQSQSQILCFADWAMLCPSFNLEIAMNASPKYFATWNHSTQPKQLCGSQLFSAGAQAINPLSPRTNGP